MWNSKVLISSVLKNKEKRKQNNLLPLSVSKNRVIPSHCARRRVQSATAGGGS